MIQISYHPQIAVLDSSLRTHRGPCFDANATPFESERGMLLIAEYHRELGHHNYLRPNLLSKFDLCIAPRLGEHVQRFILHVCRCSAVIRPQRCTRMKNTSSLGEDCDQAVPHVTPLTRVRFFQRSCLATVIKLPMRSRDSRRLNRHNIGPVQRLKATSNTTFSKHLTENTSILESHKFALVELPTLPLMTKSIS